VGAFVTVDDPAIGAGVVPETHPGRKTCENVSVALIAGQAHDPGHHLFQ
jgi:hypothetical protein